MKMCISFCFYVQPFGLATAEKLTTAFWKLHLLGVVQIEPPLFLGVFDWERRGHSKAGF
jgi:hypothetical protein